MTRLPKNIGVKRILAGCSAALLLIIGSFAFADSQGRSFPDYYPREFAGTGQIVRMQANRIVIEDQQYILSPFVTYHTPDAEVAFKSSFAKGMQVGFLTGSKNEIVSLWFLEKSDR